MNKKAFLATILLLHTCLLVLSQTSVQYRWWNPAASAFPVLDGKAWQTNLVRFYDRLPAKAEKLVRPELWYLSQQSAGEYIRFTSNASSIQVRLSVSGVKAMNHMPATGVSGVDLYALDENGRWHWARGVYVFGDTISYKFDNIAPQFTIREFRLYLPLYNNIKWMEIGVPESNTFSPLTVSEAQPLVFYGTSIMQGACASRPGLAWTNILGRKINAPIINLGFSGNGRLEEPLIDLMTETNARMFILDCQPNLHDRKIYTEKEIEQRIINAVSKLQASHPKTPILLVEHCSGSQKVNMDTAFINKYTWTSNILSKTYTAMKRNGTKNIYLLTAAEIGLDSESTIDGTHPTDIGMMKYAEAYEKAIKKILGHSIGTFPKEDSR